MASPSKQPFGATALPASEKHCARKHYAKHSTPVPQTPKLNKRKNVKVGK